MWIPPWRSIEEVEVLDVDAGTEETVVDRGAFTQRMQNERLPTVGAALEGLVAQRTDGGAPLVSQRRQVLHHVVVVEDVMPFMVEARAITITALSVKHRFVHAGLYPKKRARN